MEPHERLILDLLDAADVVGGEAVLKELEDHGLIELDGVNEDGAPVFKLARPEGEENPDE